MVRSNGRGVARIFQRGGHTLSNFIVMAFSPRNIVGCLLKKGLQRGVTGTPGPPPPRYALEWYSVSCMAQTVQNIHMVATATGS